MPAKINIEKIIDIFSEILDENDIFSKENFNKISEFINIKNYSIYFLSENMLNCVHPDKTTKIKISNKISKELFLEKLETLETIFKFKHQINYLKIKGTVFGIIVYEKKNFTTQDKIILKGLTKIISYKIKDKELSDIFNTQLNILAKAVTTANNEEKSKTEFIANISHELRTPLNAIIGFSDLLKNKKTGVINNKQEEYINNIHNSAIYLMEMINDTLDISKIESNTVNLAMQSFNIKQTTDEVLNILYPLITEKNITLKQNIQNICIKADYQKIKQILFNILSNAIKYTTDLIVIEIKEVKDNVLIKVQDNGIGIEKKNQKKIFNKFFQINKNTLKKEPSTGLGLTIVKEFVKLHNGKIELVSTVNKGSTFTIKIPKI